MKDGKRVVAEYLFLDERQKGKGRKEKQQAYFI